MTDCRSIATSLYKAGWRSGDRNELIETYRHTDEELNDLFNGGLMSEDKDDLTDEYRLTEEEVDKICELLAEFENSQKSR